MYLFVMQEAVLVFQIKLECSTQPKSKRSKNHSKVEARAVSKYTSCQVCKSIVLRSRLGYLTVITDLTEMQYRSVKPPSPQIWGS